MNKIPETAKIQPMKRRIRREPLKQVVWSMLQEKTKGKYFKILQMMKSRYNLRLGDVFVALGLFGMVQVFVIFIGNYKAEVLTTAYKPILFYRPWILPMFYVLFKST
jgi:hypothetical protein